jgi:hypothetical protein
MSECHICGEATNVDGAPYRCSYCQRDVCETHRLPENHWCIPPDVDEERVDERRRADLTRKRLPGRSRTSTSRSPDVAPDGSIVRDEVEQEEPDTRHWLFSKLFFWR